MPKSLAMALTGIPSANSRLADLVLEFAITRLQPLMALAFGRLQALLVRVLSSMFFPFPISICVNLVIT